MPAPKLSPDEITSVLQKLPNWTLKDNKLHRTFQFPDFAYAFAFMTTAAIHIEKRDHHPEWLNVYNRVTVDLTTHDANGVTGKDVELAELLDRIAAKLS